MGGSAKDHIAHASAGAPHRYLDGVQKEPTTHGLVDTHSGRKKHTKNLRLGRSLQKARDALPSEEMCLLPDGPEPRAPKHKHALSFLALAAWLRALLLPCRHRLAALPALAALHALPLSVTPKHPLAPFACVWSAHARALPSTTPRPARVHRPSRWRPATSPVAEKSETPVASARLLCCVQCEYRTLSRRFAANDAIN